MIYEMSDKNLYVLEGNMEQLERVETFPPIDTSEIRRGVRQKREYYNRDQQGLSWKSWNGAGARNGR
jgi:hypothetical protein